MSNSLAIERADIPDYYMELGTDDDDTRRQCAHMRYDAPPDLYGATSASHTPTVARSEGRSTVLIADDERSIADLLAEFLTSVGYHTLVAYDGETALRLARLYHPELLLTDLFMPGLDGLTLRRALHALPTTRDIPVALMSSARPSASKLLGAPFLPKPFDLDQALAIVEQYVAVPHDE
ncbi:MAG: response regulator [Ktedonobacterales bacterium]